MALPGVGLAQDTTPPVVVKPLGNLTVAAGTTGSVVNLKKTFGLTGVTGTVVRMATVLGNIDIEMFDADAPKNVANFLGYVNSGAYNKSFIHRSVPGFVIQGGGYYVSGQSTIIAQTCGRGGRRTQGVEHARHACARLEQRPRQRDEPMVLQSGRQQRHFATKLDDTSDGGPFTVFGRVIEGDLATVDAIAAVPVPNPTFRGRPSNGTLTTFLCTTTLPAAACRSPIWCSSTTWSSFRWCPRDAGRTRC